jgi:hypothetical protein
VCCSELWVLSRYRIGRLMNTPAPTVAGWICILIVRATSRCGCGLIGAHKKAFCGITSAFFLIVRLELACLARGLFRASGI